MQSTYNEHWITTFQNAMHSDIGLPVCLLLSHVVNKKCNKSITNQLGKPKQKQEYLNPGLREIIAIHQFIWESGWQQWETGYNTKKVILRCRSTEDFLHLNRYNTDRVWYHLICRNGVIERGPYISVLHGYKCFRRNYRRNVKEQYNKDWTKMNNSNTLDAAQNG